jgi:hypothetical protein
MGLNGQYVFDNCGNLTSDALNSNYDMMCDHRNLLIESKNSSDPNVLYMTKYYYDEGGNRVKKKVYISEDGGENWDPYSNEIYVRDVNGKEIGIYGDTTFSQWNVWGLDNAGKINSDRSRYYYIKDHLGSIRAVLNEDSRIANAQDYDAWGYILENRSYGSENSKYKFTGKERDKDLQNNYDYF